MDYIKGSKLVIKDHTLPYYTTEMASPVDGNFIAKLDRSAHFLENNYVLGMYLFYEGTYKIGSIHHILLKLARQDVFILVDADNVEKWDISPSSIKVLQEYSTILAENPGLTDEGSNSHTGPFKLTLTVSN